MSNQPKHTPGPWHVTRTNTGVRSADATVCRVWMLRNGQGIANAQLIAAAPDLLEALKTILSDEMSCHKAVYELGGFVLPDELRNQARAAIAKAEGRSE